MSGSYSCTAHLSVQLTSLWWNNYIESLMMCCFKSAIADGLLFCLLQLKKVQRMYNQVRTKLWSLWKEVWCTRFSPTAWLEYLRRKNKCILEVKMQPRFCPVQTPHLSCEMLFSVFARGQLLRGGSHPSCSPPLLVTDLLNLGLLNICICFTQAAPLPVDLSWLFYPTGFTPFGLAGPICSTCLP